MQESVYWFMPSVRFGRGLLASWQGWFVYTGFFVLLPVRRHLPCQRRAAGMGLGQETVKAPNHSIERTAHRRLRQPPAAAHVKRQAALEGFSMARTRACFVVTMLILLITGCAGQNRLGTSNDFLAFLERMDGAQHLLQQGQPDTYKSLWSRGDDVTLAGGFGGRFEQGWNAVSQRLDWAGSNFVNGNSQIQRLSYSSDQSLGYVVQTEHLIFQTPSGATAERNYRVTMLFRKENGAWRIIHRHADSQASKESPR